MAYPKIQYVDNDANSQELLFQMPPVNNPAVWKEAQRHDVIASGGEKQSTHERTDEFFSIDMPVIYAGDDVGAWSTFLAWAIEGGEFEYFADADIDDSITCTLEETAAKPERKFFGVYGVKLTFRVAVA